jgi:hypothetical protein
MKFNFSQFCSGTLFHPVYTVLRLKSVVIIDFFDYILILYTSCSIIFQGSIKSHVVSCKLNFVLINISTCCFLPVSIA